MCPLAVHLREKQQACIKRYTPKVIHVSLFDNKPFKSIKIEDMRDIEPLNYNYINNLKETTP